LISGKDLSASRMSHTVWGEGVAWEVAEPLQVYFP
jgi:hypothetical protein